MEGIILRGKRQREILDISHYTEREKTEILDISIILRGKRQKYLIHRLYVESKKYND